MADHNLIADVSQALVELLRSALVEVDEGVVVVPHTLDKPVDTSVPTVTLYLYQVHEDDTVLRSRGRSTSSARPPLALSLSYLVTAWSDSAILDQRLLGKVVQVFHGHPLMGRLRGDFDGDSPARVMLEPLTLEDKTRMWEAIGQPFRLSVAYAVRVVGIEPRELTQVKSHSSLVSG